MTYYKPLTPTLRRKILDASDAQLAELSECQQTTFVCAYRTGYQAFKNLIKRLPDGYPIPFEENGKDMREGGE